MGSSSPPTQTVYTNSNPPQYVQPFLNEIANQASQMFHNNTVPSYYPNSTVVPFSSQTQEALNMAENVARNQNTLNPQAYQAASSIMQSRGLNPLAQGAIGQLNNIANGTNQITTGNQYGNLAQSIANGNPQFEAGLQGQLQNAANQVNAQFSQGGRYGSGAQAQALGTSLGNIRSQALSQQYNQDITNQLQALQGQTNVQGANIANQGNTAQTLGNIYQNAQDYLLRTALAAPSLQMSQYNNAAQLGQVGSAYEQQQQAQLQDAINRWNAGQMQPWTGLNLYSNAVNGVSQGGTSTSLTQLPQQSFGQRILGGAALGGGMGSMIGGPITSLLGAAGGGLLGLL